MSAGQFKILDNLLRHHPELEQLRTTHGGRAVVDAAPLLARVLMGALTETGHPVIDAVLKGAPQELSILTGLCRGNPLRALTTTVSILKFLARLLDRDEEEQSDENSGDPEGEETAEGVSVSAPRQDEEEDGEEKNDEDEGAPAPGGLDDLDAEQMVDQAFEQVNAQSETLDQLSQLLPDMGWGFGRGHLEAALLEDMERFTRLLERAESLKKIADELGRMERARRKRKPSGRRGRESVVGVRFGGELTDALPTELAMLGSRATEDLFYQRYTEQRLLSLELEGASDEPDDAGKNGPIIACVDTSGSMAGAREVIAKALILSVMRQALPRGRRVRLMLFGGPGDFRDMDLGRGPGAMKHFLDFLAMSFHAGTDFDGPLERAMTLLSEQRYEQADVLLVTDGYGRARPEQVRRLSKLRDSVGFEVVSVVIGGAPHGVAPFSDRVWTIPAQEGALDHIEITEWDGRLGG